MPFAMPPIALLGIGLGLVAATASGSVAASLRRYKAGAAAAEARLQTCAQRLRQTDEQLAVMAADNDSWLWWTDADLRFTELSDHLSGTSGLSASRMLGRCWADVAAGPAADTAALLADLEARRPFRNVALEVENDAGETRFMRISGMPLLDAAGRFQGYCGSSRDVTSAVQTERSAAHDAHLVDQVLDSVEMGVCLIDQELRTVLFNRSFPDLLDLPQGRIAPGTPLQDILALCIDHGGPADHGDVRQLADAAAQRQRRQLERTLRSGRTVHLSILPMSHGAVLTAVDITERLRTESDLRRASESAERASLAKTEFLANVSHELRTPLNAIMGFSEILASEMFGPLGHDTYRAYARDIHSSGRHLLQVIGDILDVSKVEFGKLELNAEWVDLPQVAESVARLLEPQAKRNSVTVDIPPAGPLPRLHADEQRLRQILINLIANAIKFTPENGRVVVDAAMADDGVMVCRVRDTGIGIAPEDLPRALMAFQQIDNVMHRKFQGTGLGLPLSKALVELHGGALEIDSAIGAGTTVTVTFPASRVETTEAAAG